MIIRLRFFISFFLCCLLCACSAAQEVRPSGNTQVEVKIQRDILVGDVQIYALIVDRKSDGDGSVQFKIYATMSDLTNIKVERGDGKAERGGSIFLLTMYEGTSREFADKVSPGVYSFANGAVVPGNVFRDIDR